MIAWSAFVLSVAGLLFTGYQWREGRSQARINAAVDLSRAYLVDPEIAKRYALLVDGKAEPTPGSYETYLRARSYLDLLDYIAHLANEELIDNRYLNGRIKCDIHWVLKKATIPPAYRLGKDMHKYVAELKASACPDLPPSSDSK